MAWHGMCWSPSPAAISSHQIRSHAKHHGHKRLSLRNQTATLALESILPCYQIPAARQKSRQKPRRQMYYVDTFFLAHHTLRNRKAKQQKGKQTRNRHIETVYYPPVYETPSQLHQQETRKKKKQRRPWQEKQKRNNVHIESYKDPARKKKKPPCPALFCPNAQPKTSLVLPSLLTP